VNDAAQPPADDAFLEELVCDCLEDPDPRAALRHRLADRPQLLPRALRLLDQVARLEALDATQLVADDEPQPDQPGSWPTIPGVELQALVGRGGQGFVFRGRQTYLDRVCAVKVLAPSLQHSSFVPRFRREARLLAGLQHPHIVACHDAGVTDRQQCYLVMEWIDGPNLRQWLDQHGKLPWPRAVELAQQIAQALAHAHARGLIHRDVKPENVLLQPDGSGGPFARVAKLADLGLARSQQRPASAGADSLRTATGAWLGTPATMAPEQYDHPEQVDHRADIYGLGCILHHALCGAPAFVGNSHTDLIVQKAALRGPGSRPPLPGVPPEVSHLVWRMLASDAADRPQSYAELLALLAAARQTLDRAPRRARARPAIVLTTALVGLLGAGWVYSQWFAAPVPPPALVVAAPNELVEGELGTLAWSGLSRTPPQEVTVRQTAGPRARIAQTDAEALRVVAPLGAAGRTLQFTFTAQGLPAVVRELAILPSPLRQPAADPAEDLFPGGTLGRWRTAEPQRWLAEDTGRGAVLNNPRGKTTADSLAPLGPFTLRGAIEPRFRYVSPSEPRAPVAEVALRIELGEFAALVLQVVPDGATTFVARWLVQVRDGETWRESRELQRARGPFVASAPLRYRCIWRDDVLSVSLGTVDAPAAETTAELPLAALPDAAAPGRLELSVDRGVAVFTDWRLGRN
jgi:hypothetical protein